VKPALLLAASGISSAQVSAALDGLDLDQVKIQPAPGWLALLWGGSVSAMTLGNTVYVTPASLDTDPAKLGLLIVHELVHVHQWAQLGAVRFLWRYLSGYLRGRFTGLSHQDAYRAIPFEVEARQLASQMEGPIGPI
jgi:hypothetical protein